jgi:DNA-binding transcriptional regulator YiaG
MDIKKIRKDLGLTQEDFARKVGVSWSTVARWEAGKGHPSRLAQRNIEKLIK